MENLLFLKVQMLGYDFNQTLDHFREYLGVSRENFEENHSNHKIIVKKDLQNLKPNETDDLYYWSDQEIEKLTLVFPSILNESHFLASFSLFERLIVILCEAVKSELGVKGELRQQNRVGQAKALIIKHGKVDFSSLQSTWTKIDLYRDIRNQIAHFGGYLNSKVKKDEALRCMLTDERLFKIENDRIEVQEQGCYRSLTDYGIILKGLIDQVFENHKPLNYKEPF